MKVSYVVLTEHICSPTLKFCTAPGNLRPYISECSYTDKMLIINFITKPKDFWYQSQGFMWQFVHLQFEDSGPNIAKRDRRLNCSLALAARNCKLHLRPTEMPSWFGSFFYWRIQWNVWLVRLRIPHRNCFDLPKLSFQLTFHNKMYLQFIISHKNGKLCYFVLIK